MSSSVVPFSSCFLSFPASGCFQMSQFFTLGGQSIEISASASFVPMDIQDWFPLGLTGLISLQSKGFSRVFSNTTVQKPWFMSVYGKNHYNTSEMKAWSVFKQWTELASVKVLKYVEEGGQKFVNVIKCSILTNWYLLELDSSLKHIHTTGVYLEEGHCLPWWLYFKGWLPGLFFFLI